MLKQWILSCVNVKIELDDGKYIVKTYGVDGEGDYLLEIDKFTKNGILVSSSLEEINGFVDEMNKKIMQSNKFRIWLDSEEI